VCRVQSSGFSDGSRVEGVVIAAFVLKPLGQVLARPKLTDLYQNPEDVNLSKVLKPLGQVALLHSVPWGTPFLPGSITCVHEEGHLVPSHGSLW